MTSRGRLSRAGQTHHPSFICVPSPGSLLTLGCCVSDGVPVWTVPKSPSGELLKNGGLTPLCSAEPSPALSKRRTSHGPEVRDVTKHHIYQLLWFSVNKITQQEGYWGGLSHVSLNSRELKRFDCKSYSYLLYSDAFPHSLNWLCRFCPC